MGKIPTYIRVQSLKNKGLIADKCFVAERFFSRLRGLIGKSGLESGHGILFPKCNNIHMWFMRFPIDVVFIRSELGTDGNKIWKVSSVHENVKPWRLLPLMDWRGSETLELPNGTIRQHTISTGDELC